MELCFHDLRKPLLIVGLIAIEGRLIAFRHILDLLYVRLLLIQKTAVKAQLPKKPTISQGAKSKEPKTIDSHHITKNVRTKHAYPWL